MNNFRLGGFSINTDAIKKPHSASYDEVVVDINAQGGVNDGGVIGGEVQIENPNDREDIYYGYNAEEVRAVGSMRATTVTLTIHVPSTRKRTVNQ